MKRPGGERGLEARGEEEVEREREMESRRDEGGREEREPNIMEEMRNLGRQARCVHLCVCACVWLCVCNTRVSYDSILTLIIPSDSILYLKISVHLG